VNKKEHKILNLPDEIDNKFLELHTHFHNIENNYHNVLFHTYYNSFINTYQIIFNQIENKLKDTLYIKEYKKLKNNYWEKEPLLKDINNQRNLIVHEKDLEINTFSYMCLIKNKKTYDIKIKLFLSNTFLDSDELIIKYLKIKYFYQIFMNDEDYYLTIYREIKTTKNECILEEVKKLLLLMGDFIHVVYGLIGFCNNKNKTNFTLECIHPINDIKYKFYDRNKLKVFI